METMEGAAATKDLPKFPATITKSKILTASSPFTSHMMPAPVLPNEPAAITKSKMLTVPSPYTSPVSFSASGTVVSPATVIVSAPSKKPLQMPPHRC